MGHGRLFLCSPIQFLRFFASASTKDYETKWGSPIFEIFWGWNGKKGSILISSVLRKIADRKSTITWNYLSYLGTRLCVRCWIWRNYLPRRKHQLFMSIEAVHWKRDTRMESNPPSSCRSITRTRGRTLISGKHSQLPMSMSEMSIFPRTQNNWIQAVKKRCCDNVFPLNQKINKIKFLHWLRCS